jgi:FkbM family methyltransferase
MHWSNFTMAAENQIDEIILRNFFKNQAQCGTLIEVGAAGPEYLSMGETFRKLGWNVVAIEPNPAFCAVYREKGIPILEYACGDRDEDNVPFYIIKSIGAYYEGGEVTYESFSSLGVEGKYLELQQKVPTESNEIQVKLRRLDTLLREFHPEISGVDVLSIDVEGHELSVLRGFSIDYFKPKVIIIENLFNMAEYDRYMTVFNYKKVGVIGPNEIYISEEFQKYLSC